MREPNLYKELAKARSVEQSGKRKIVEDGVLTVLHPDPFRAYTKLGNHFFKPQSAFMRTSHCGPLSRGAQSSIRTSLVRLLIKVEKSGLLQRLEFVPGNHKLQGWGVKATFDALVDVIVPPGMDDIRSALSDYVDLVIVRANVQGRSSNIARDCRDVWTRIEASNNFRREGSIGDGQTLLDIALGVDEPGLPLRNRAELFTLLTLSLVGFTGIALEWCVLEAFTRRGKLGSWAGRSQTWQLVSEALRLRPSAWKLVRDDFDIPDSDEFFDSLMLMVHTVHLSPQHWERPEVFNPDRWIEGSGPVEGYFPFGSHKMICPARQFAFSYLDASLKILISDFEVKVPRIRGRPYVSILYSPAAQTIRLRRLAFEN